MKSIISAILSFFGSRSPHGERGLKSRNGLSLGEDYWSLPARGAWIEIGYIDLIAPEVACRSPHGERGLKYELVQIVLAPLNVAPRTGSVD